MRAVRSRVAGGAGLQRTVSRTQRRVLAVEAGEHTVEVGLWIPQRARLLEEDLRRAAKNSPGFVAPYHRMGAGAGR